MNYVHGQLCYLFDDRNGAQALLQPLARQPGDLQGRASVALTYPGACCQWAVGCFISGNGSRASLKIALTSGCEEAYVVALPLVLDGAVPYEEIPKDAPLSLFEFTQKCVSFVAGVEDERVSDLLDVIARHLPKFCGDFRDMEMLFLADGFTRPDFVPREETIMPRYSRPRVWRAEGCGSEADVQVAFDNVREVFTHELMLFGVPLDGARRNVMSGSSTGRPDEYLEVVGMLVGLFELKREGVGLAGAQEQVVRDAREHVTQWVRTNGKGRIALGVCNGLTLSIGILRCGKNGVERTAECNVEVSFAGGL
jgi:hypothetical protein